MARFKKNFEHVVAYANSKIKNSNVKTFWFGFMASFFVAIAYIIYIQSVAFFSHVDNYGVFHVDPKGWFIAALVFPMGLLLIIFVGGSLFTSDCLSVMSVFDGKAKYSQVFKLLSLTLLGNLAGAIFSAVVLRASGIFGQNELMVVAYLVSKKVWLGASSLYLVLFSGILCNILVAGTVWSVSSLGEAVTAKVLIVFILIWCFTISGFHHVVANMILFWFAILHGDITMNAALWSDVANAVSENKISYYQLLDLKVSLHDGLSFSWIVKSVIFNLIPAAIGNFISGSMMLPIIYWWLLKGKPDFKFKRIKS
ncbi:formate/nitrite transporter family protein [Candidatus Mycoplasma pogonae]